MSRVHFKAEYIKQEGQEVFYKYCPDTIYERDVRGEFKFNLNEWQPIITLLAEPKGEEVYYTDEHCINALTYKIKKHFEENKKFPKEIFFIA